MSYTLIATDQALVDLRKSFQARNIQTIAMDFEGEFNLHCYGEHLCLIQIFDGTNSYIVDPLKISPVELKNTLESEALVKLFYGAGSGSSMPCGCSEPPRKGLGFGSPGDSFHSPGE